MKETSNLQLPYPELSDIADGGAQMRGLAYALDAPVGGPLTPWSPTLYQGVNTGAPKVQGLDPTSWARYKVAGRELYAFGYLKISETTSTPGFFGVTQPYAAFPDSFENNGFGWSIAMRSNRTVNTYGGVWASVSTYTVGSVPVFELEEQGGTAAVVGDELLFAVCSELR